MRSINLLVQEKVLKVVQLTEYKSRGFPNLKPLKKVIEEAKDTVLFSLPFSVLYYPTGENKKKPTVVFAAEYEWIVIGSYNNKFLFIRCSDMNIFSKLSEIVQSKRNASEVIRTFPQCIRLCTVIKQTKEKQVTRTSVSGSARVKEPPMKKRKFNPNVEEWTEEDVAQFINKNTSLGDRYSSHIHAQNINGEVLKTMSAEDWKAIGIASQGHIRTLEIAVQTKLP